MAEKKTLKKKSPKIEFQGYLSVNLTKEQDAAFDTWVVGKKGVFDPIESTVLAGYKVAFAEDVFNDGVVCSMYCNSTKIPWAGWTLTAWADGLEEALWLLWYKHFEICEQDWEKFRGAPSKSHAKRG